MNNDKSLEANKTVKKYAIASSGMGVIPFPLIDMVILATVQLKMLQNLTQTYEIPFTENTGKSLIASLVGSGASLSLSVNLAKAIPVYGTLIGVISRFSFCSASTYAIGKVFIQHFETGGTLLDFDPKEMRQFYQQQFESGKLKAQQNFAGVKP